MGRGHLRGLRLAREYWVGRSLIERNAERYAREADLRFSLVRVNEHIDAIALAGGEAEEARRIELDLAGVLLAMRRLITGLMNLTWVTAGYGWFTLVAPILAAAPLYFAGNLSFGGLMMASGAFVQVQSSLRWFVDNASTLADWRATLLRVASFRCARSDCPEIMAAVRSTGRRTALLAGFETDVCVTHSAVGLGEAGYRVVIVEDAVYSPFGAHLPGIARLRDLGFELMRCKSVYYDWIRTWLLRVRSRSTTLRLLILPDSRCEGFCPSSRSGDPVTRLSGFDDDARRYGCLVGRPGGWIMRPGIIDRDHRQPACSTAST